MVGTYEATSLILNSQYSLEKGFINDKSNGAHESPEQPGQCTRNKQQAGVLGWLICGPPMLMEGPFSWTNVQGHSE